MPRAIVQGRYRGLDLMLVKPLTFMNDSGLAVRKVLAREHAPLGDLLVVADDFALPFGKLRFREGGGPGGHNGLRLDHRRARAPRSSAGCGSGSARRIAAFVDHVLTHVRARRAASGSTSCSMPPPTRSRSGRATGRARPPTGSTRSSSGRPTPTGSRRPARSTGRPAGRHPPDEDRLATAPAGRGRRMTTQRRSAASAAPSAGSANASPTSSPTPPRSTPSGGRLRRRRRRSRGRASSGGRGRRERRGRRPGVTTRDAPRPAPRRGGRPGAACRTCRRCRRCSRRPARSRRSASGSGPRSSPRPDRPPRRPDVGPARREDATSPRPSPWPRGGERLVWVARDAEIGDRVAEELAAWLGDPARRRRPRAADRARLRAERARRRRDGRAGRGPRRPGGAGRARILVASVQALLQHTIAPDDLPAEPRELAIGGRLAPGRAAPRAARPRLRAGARGRRPGRVRAPRRHRRRVPAVGAAAGPDRVLRRRDRLAARLRPDRPADGRPARASRRSCPRREFLAPRAARPRIRVRGSVARPRSCPSGSPRTSPGSRATATRPAAGDRRTVDARPRRRRRRRGLGAASSPRRPASTTSTPGHAPRPRRAGRPRRGRPSSCGARPTSGAPS